MKEATGELNITVIAVVAIAAVGVIFTTLVLPGIRRSIKLTNACNASNNGRESYSDGDVSCSNGQCTSGNTTKTCSNN